MHVGVGSVNINKLSRLSNVSMPRKEKAAYFNLRRFFQFVGIALVTAVLFQFASGGLTVTTLVLKTFVYVSFLLLCILFGCTGILCQESPIKPINFDTSNNSAYLLDFLNTIPVS